MRTSPSSPHRGCVSRPRSRLRLKGPHRRLPH
ncbi:hypothetical protein IEO21_11234 [Rhodonia placenta]|uniref:Uncharacterized protein n=1 Tax=Rhodonia placenta TaxID=104341 RepID=A0A8H7NQR7_9APHY|nr:hypothetical protein IEO21_11234 [Postia placenta]